MTKILLVEDEISIRNSLQDYLSREGFAVTIASNFKEADAKFKGQEALILLDWMLPDGQGIELVKKWRSQGYSTPIIFLTARAELIDKVLGLELGANDYVVKPFEPRELVARMRVQLRSNTPAGQKTKLPLVLEVADIALNETTHEVFYLGAKIELAKTEYQLLKLFLENPSQVFSREELLKRVWGYEQYPSTRTVDTHILNLRNKTNPEYFETVHKIGYRFRVKENNK